MPYFINEDFKAGIDVRKAPATSPAGTLRELTNAHITPGGEIEKRKALVDQETDLTGTFGLCAINDQVFVLGQGARPGTLPVEIGYIDLVGGPNPADRLVDWDVYDGQLYTVIKDTSNLTQHYYNGAHVPLGEGEQIKTYKDKIYGIEDSILSFSAVGDPTDWEGTGSGFINISTQDGDSSELLGIEVYFNELLIMSRRASQTYAVDADPAQNINTQLIRNAGTVAPLSVIGVGNGDVYFLSDNGLRSFQARDSSLAASVSDIGSPIDPILIDLLLDLGRPLYSTAFSLVETLSSRFWVIIQGDAYVLSFFPGPKVTAWSKYELGFIPEHGVVAGNRILLRAGDDLYLYGGVDGKTYGNDYMVTAVLPFSDFQTPGNYKQITAIDAVADGTWNIDIALDPNQPAAFERVATFNGITYPLQALPVVGNSSHIAHRLTHQGDGYARFSNLTTHFQTADAS